MFNSLYHDQVIPFMRDTFSYNNPMLVPSISKVCLNVGLGLAVSDSSVLSSVIDELTLIAGQKAVSTEAKKSIASFKLRKGMKIGCKVTLRKSNMYNFLEKLVYIALPSQRDFKGISKQSVSDFGTCSFSIKEHIVFPEIDYDKVRKIFGINVNIVTTANSSSETVSFLSKFGIPFYG